MQERLNPCPFCGRHNLKMKTKNRDGRILYAARCEDCGLHGPVSGDELIAKISWNLLPSIGEADWLAEKLLFHTGRKTLRGWREAARKEVEAEHGHAH